jgi:mRNA-degrading endonuclease RelE of RelBE toxin-antitoxin system
VADPYQVLLARSAHRALTERLPAPVAAAVVEFLAGPLSAEPHQAGKPLLAPFEGLWSARRGAYRILYRMHDVARTIRVERVEHRADVYRP